MNANEQAAAYEPIFYHHPNERWVPVHPSGYLAAAKLWLAKNRREQGRKDPRNWGRCRMPVPPAVPSSFEQGKPMIPRERISVNPADEKDDYLEGYDGDFYYLGHDEEPGSRDKDCCNRWFPFTETTDECENFLDVGGWQDTLDVDCDNPDYHTHPGVDHAHDIWTSGARENDLDIAYVEILDAKPGLSDEIVTELLTRFELDDLRVFLYYALFPMHEEELGGTRADYEGDWVCLAVLAPPAAEDATQAPPPVAVGYGSRRRVGSGGDTFRIRFADDFKINMHAGHPKGFVATGTHNLHSQPGGDRSPAAEELAEQLEKLVEQANEALEGLDTAKDVIVMIIKIVAGWGLFGPIGAVFGAIAGGIEMAVSDPPQIDIGEGRPSDDRDVPGGGDDVPEGAFGLILAPEAVRATVPEAGAASTVRRWRNNLDQRVVDRQSQPWWRETECLSVPEEPTRPAYAGRWGVLCTDDRLDCRSGMPFADFLCALNESLLIELSADPDA
jgi:hypothetical protein